SASMLSCGSRTPPSPPSLQTHPPPPPMLGEDEPDDLLPVPLLNLREPHPHPRFYGIARTRDHRDRNVPHHFHLGGNHFIRQVNDHVQPRAQRIPFTGDDLRPATADVHRAPRQKLRLLHSVFTGSFAAAGAIFNG